MEKEKIKNRLKRLESSTVLDYDEEGFERWLGNYTLHRLSRFGHNEVLVRHYLTLGMSVAHNHPECETTGDLEPFIEDPLEYEAVVYAYQVYEEVKEALRVEALAVFLEGRHFNDPINQDEGTPYVVDFTKPESPLREQWHKKRHDEFQRRMRRVYRYGEKAHGEDETS